MKITAVEIRACRRNADRFPAAAIKNCEFFEMLGPADAFSFGLAEPFPIKDGVAHLPTKPGLGIDLDWPEIERCTLAVL